MKTHNSIWVVRLGCNKRTNPILRCFVNSKRLNYEDLLVGMVHEFVDLANGLRLSTEVPSQDLSGVWITVRG
jgi:hypothetical protein